MKKLILSFLLAFACLVSKAQTATDFTAYDCAGTLHNLFSELDSGKIVVLTWVMPCPGCEVPGKEAYDTAMAYQACYPGRVRFYLIDDYGTTDCSILTSWANFLAIYSTNFSDSTIRMTDYGRAGMPKIVVLAGINHGIYYIEDDSLNGPALHNAIDSALFDITGINNSLSASQINIFPNPVAQEYVSISGLKPGKNNKIEIFNLLGDRIQTIYFSSESEIINIAELSNGSYILKITQGSSFIVKKISVFRQ